MADPTKSATPVATPTKPEKELQAEAAPGMAWGARRVPRDTRLEALPPARIRRLLDEAERGDIAAQCELFEHMEERDEELDGHLRTRKAGVAQAEWTIEPADETPAASQAADFCRETVDGIPNLPDAIFDLLDAIPKGLAVQEIKWETSKSEWRPVELIYRPQRWFGYADDGLTLGLRTQSAVTVDPMNPLNFIVHRSRARSGFGPRVGLLRSCVRPFVARHYAWKDWLAFGEVYGMPARIGKLREGVPWDSEEAKQLYEAVRALGQDFAAVVGAGNEIEFLEIANRGLAPYEAIVDRAGKALTIAILGQLLTSGGERGGSFALGEVHNQVRFDLIQSDATALGRTLTEQLLRPIIRLNKGEAIPVPAWHFVVEAPEDLGALATTTKTLVEAGLRIPAKWAYEKFAIPEPEGDEEVLVAAPKLPGFGAAQAAGNASANAVQARRRPPASALLAGLVSNAAFVAEARRGGLAPARLLQVLNQATPPGGPGPSAYKALGRDALDWAAERRVVDQAVWDALSGAGRQRAWWVTGLDQEATARLAELLQEAMQKGWSENEFLDRIEGAGLAVPGGQEPAAGQIANWQARLVHDNNRWGAYHAAQWQGMLHDAAERPYAQWLCGGSPCPICDPLCGKVGPIEIFAGQAPMLHHGCQCELVNVSQAEVDREGIEPLSELPPADVPADWLYDRRDAYYIEARGQGPHTESGRADQQLLATQPLPADLIGE